jgi:hypothetical protein
MNSPDCPMPGTPDLAWRTATCARHGGTAREADGVYTGGRFICGACWRGAITRRNLKHSGKSASAPRQDTRTVA